MAPVLLRRPRGQFRAPDLGVVADVDREARVEEEGFDPCSVHEAIAEMAQFVGDARPLVARDTRAQLDAQHGALRAALADPDQRGAPHPGMDVEPRIDLFGAQGAGGADHALGLANAEPEAAAGVEVAAVAQAVDAAGTCAPRARPLTH